MKAGVKIARQLVLSSIVLSAASYGFAETATAQQEDAIVARQIVRQHDVDEQQAPAASAANISPVQAYTGEEKAVALPAFDQPIIDPLNILSTTEKAQIDQKIRNIYQTGKAQIGVVIVATTGQQDIFSYSLKIAEDWKLGSEKYDNGVLIVMARQDRRIQILTGYGLEGVLPDIVVSQIIRNQITPEFKQEKYGLGILNGINELEKILAQDPDVARQAAEQLKEQQEMLMQQEKAQQNSMGRAVFILILAAFASAVIGHKLAGVGAGVLGFISSLIAGSGFGLSLLIGFALFFLIISGIAQGVIQIAGHFNGGGRGGGRGGGFSGGGGGFGGGGASGSW